MHVFVLLVAHLTKKGPLCLTGCRDVETASWSTAVALHIQFSPNRMTVRPVSCIKRYLLQNVARLFGGGLVQVVATDLPVTVLLDERSPSRHNKNHLPYKQQANSLLLAYPLHRSHAMKSTPSFAERLRSLRIAADRSMGEVARALGLTTVYYSEVENGKKHPFPPDTVDYGKLAGILNAERSELERLSLEGRSKLGLSLKPKRPQDFEIALALARRLNDSSLTAEEIAKIRSILDDDRSTQ